MRAVERLEYIGRSEAGGSWEPWGSSDAGWAQGFPGGFADPPLVGGQSKSLSLFGV